MGLGMGELMIIMIICLMVGVVPLAVGAVFLVIHLRKKREPLVRGDEHPPPGH